MFLNYFCIFHVYHRRFAVIFSLNLRFYYYVVMGFAISPVAKHETGRTKSNRRQRDLIFEIECKIVHVFH